MREKLFHRDFTLVVIGQIISLLGNAVLRFVLPLYLLDVTGSRSLFGLCSAAAFVPMVVLSTASPFKFPRSVLEALGRTAPENDFEAMQQLEAATAHTAPASLAALRQKPERFNTVIDPAQIAEVALGYQE